MRHGNMVGGLMRFSMSALLGGSCLFSLLVGACSPISRMKDGLDRWSFSHTGGTVFSEPFQVTTKQLHFDTGNLFGKDVVIEGDIQEKGDVGTHLVLLDPEGRMLVVLTEVDDSYQLL